MDKKKVWLTSLSGFVAGVVLTFIVVGVAGFMAAPGLMIIEDESPLSFEDTVQAIRDSATDHNWKIPTVHEIHNAVNAAGYDVLPVAVIELCHPDHAAKVLAEDQARIVTPLMPCRVSVYETSDGRVIVSRMNSGLVSKVFGGTVAEVMARASAENEEILAPVLQ